MNVSSNSVTAAENFDPKLSKSTQAAKSSFVFCDAFVQKCKFISKS